MNVTKVYSYVIFFFLDRPFICDVGIANMTMEPSNIRKDKVTTKCDKSNVTCNIGTIQCDNETFKDEKIIIIIIIIIIRVQLNMAKV